MSQARTTTTVQTHTNGTVTVTTLTETSASAGSVGPIPEAAPPVALDPEEERYRAAVSALTTGLARRSPVGPNGPQVEEGTLNIMPLLTPSPHNGCRFYQGRIFAEEHAPGDLTEHWVVVDPSLLGAVAYRIGSVSTSAIDWEEILDEVKTAFDGQDGVPHWEELRYAAISAEWLEPPSTATINNLPSMPAQHERRIFDVININSSGVETVVGGLYQDIYPIGSLNRVDHWRLLPAYTEPIGGEQHPIGTGTVTVVRPRMFNPQNPSWPYGPRLTPPSVKDFLLEFDAQGNNGGYYIQSTYSWGSLP